MKKEVLKQIIIQIKKYDLEDAFSNIEEFNNWVSKLNSTQISNFLSLDIDLEEIKEVRCLLIDNNLLNCKDYKQRVVAISKLKNGDGCWHLFKTICKPNFLNSNNFYKDIEVLSKADTARYGLWILGEDAFINSPYHDEDLKLLVETHDTDRENPLDFVVSDAIATVASNIDSIRSPYHRADMKLIATVGSSCLQMSHTYPKGSLNNLAVNKVSLADKYHSENMHILASKPIASEFLYIIMTDPNFVKGKNYRKEVEALVNAKSKTTARALYYYIVNPKKKYFSDMDFLRDCKYDIKDAYISGRNSVAGSNDSDYLKNLIRINEIDDELVMYFVSLLMNPNFINSSYKTFDLELLQSISSKPIFMDLYILMNEEVSLNNKYHKRDATIISQAAIDDVRNLLLEKACNEYSLNSSSHESDMELISRLDLGSISKEIYCELYYYLFNSDGIDDKNRNEKIKKLLSGEYVPRDTSVSSYLDDLQSQLDSNNFGKKGMSRILSLFKRHSR